MNEECFEYVLNAVSFVANNGWKYLPLYTFYPDTGEWIHNNNKKWNTWYSQNSVT